ncbi:MAG TPA: adenylosuccinate synthase [Dehalococcoidia bacterium]|nr:adenylosuccinate synthase [Dehalococcoidia bacterium]
MSVVALVGGQWGDEGKGKVTDLLAEQAHLVIRFSGGDNAGHTVINPQGEFKLHLTPSGIFHRGTVCILGNGVAINPEVLLQELDDLHKKGIDTSKLLISDRAHIIMPYHTLLDRLEEERIGKKAIGTTLKGIGPVFSDKIARLGIRACDLLDLASFKERLAVVLSLKNTIITRVYGAEALSLDAVFEKYTYYAGQLAKHIRETGTVIQDAIVNNKRILLEGAQGAMLDPDFGTYPYVTSSSPLAASASTGSGIAFNLINRIIGVYKAYTTRVGSGPMPTELHDEIGEMIRQRAHEFGTTTGRPRRCGWFDAVVSRFTRQLNGCTGIALTRLDILDNLPTIKICRSYELDGRVIDYLPTSNAELEKCRPVLEEMPGWQRPINDIRDFNKLPKATVNYIARLEELLGCPVDIISVGARREQTIMVREVY